MSQESNGISTDTKTTLIQLATKDVFLALHWYCTGVEPRRLICICLLSFPAIIHKAKPCSQSVHALQARDCARIQSVIMTWCPVAMASTLYADL